MTEFAHPATDYSVVERESPDVMARGLAVGARLWSTATLFFFFAFLFAYFYLRSLNSADAWRPKGVDPSLTLGTLATAAVVVAAALLRLAFADHRAGNREAWRRKGGVSIGLLLAGLGLQVAEWSTQGFGPTDGGYASVYLGWTGMQTIFVLGLLYWLETTLATSVRYRKVMPAEFVRGEATGDAHREAPDIEDPLSLVRAQLEGLSFFALFLAGTAAASWVVLYLV